MNNREKEVIQAALDSEAKTLTKLKKIYEKALSDIENNIASLMGRSDAGMQYVIYQIEYQKALKKQITSILETMQNEEFTTISDYLTKSYEDGYFGTMYDLHGQGIPIIAPINQKNVVRAVQHNTKLSKRLYDSLGEDVTLLNKRIQNNISRGFSQGWSYAEIARAIKSGMVGDYSGMKGGALGKAYTIARTEAHRIQANGHYDASIEAKKAGADVVKQWDATLDKRTRPDHALLDGQIREIDEPFEVNGHNAMYPGEFGIPKEDINCRCRYLQRAKWALDEDELEELKKRAEYFGLDKTKDLDEFKKKYIEATEEAVSSAKINPGGITNEEYDRLKQYARAASGNQTSFTVEAFMNGDYEILQKSGLQLSDFDDGTLKIEEWKPTKGKATDFVDTVKGTKIELSETKVVAKDLGSVTASAGRTGIIEINTRDTNFSLEVFDHEIGHQISNGNHTIAQMIIENPGDIFGRYNQRIMKFDGIYGEYSPEEAFATAMSVFRNNPADLMTKYPDTYTAISGVFKGTNASEIYDDFYKSYKKLLKTSNIK